MFRTIAAAGVLAAGLFALPVAPAMAADVTPTGTTQATQYAADVAIVGLKDGVSATERQRLINLGTAAGLTVEDRGYYLYVKGSYRTAVITYRYQPSVAYVEQDQIITLPDCHTGPC